MDRQLLERMVGAAVLIVALVLVVPAILDGPKRTAQREPGGAELADTPMRTVTIRPAAAPSRPPVPTPRPAGESAPPAQAEMAAHMAAAAKAAAEIKPAAGPTAPPPSAPAGLADPPTPAVPPAASSSGSAAVHPPGWAVQLGSFARRDNATRLAQAVEGKGFSSYLEPLNSGGRTLYRVRVGPVADREAAGRLASRLAAAGYRGQLVRQPADGVGRR